MLYKVNESDYSGQKIFIGIDVHLKEWKVTILLEETPFKTLSMDPSAHVLRTYLDRNFPGGEYYSAYEAGFTGFSTHRDLELYGIYNMVVNPADIPTTDKEKKQKEDKRDSRKIAYSLKNGQLQPIYVLSTEMEELRYLVRYRKTLVREISRYKSRIKSFLYRNGIKIPLELSSDSIHWSSNFSKWLVSVRLSTEYGHLVLPISLDTVNQLRNNLLRITKELKKVIRTHSLYQQKISNLTRICGIGFVIAITFLTEIENIKRFSNRDQLSSFVGLVPSTHSSGEREKTGDISPRKNKYLREMLIESAWVAVRNDSSLTRPFVHLCKRMDPNKAIIRIAKKLLMRIKFVLVNDTPYEISKA